jgi:hypothetical protein
MHRHAISVLQPVATHPKTYKGVKMTFDHGNFPAAIAPPFIPDPSKLATILQVFVESCFLVLNSDRDIMLI